MASIEKSIRDCYCKTGVGGNSDAVVKHLGKVLLGKYGVKMDTVFTDRASMYFEAPVNSVVKFGYSRDHRSDWSQVNVGLSMDRDSEMPMGSTMAPGNILDVTHFPETFRQILPLLHDDSVIVFDNGAYSKGNVALLESCNCGFVTRLELNKSEIDFVRCHRDSWNMVDDEIMCIECTGNKGRKRRIFFSMKRNQELLDMYRRKAENEYGDTKVRSSTVNESPERFVRRKMKSSIPPNALPISSDRSLITAGDNEPQGSVSL